MNKTHLLDLAHELLQAVPIQEDRNTSSFVIALGVACAKTEKSG